MPTILTGVVDDADILSNQRVVDMSPTIAQLEPDLGSRDSPARTTGHRASFAQLLVLSL